MKKRGFTLIELLAVIVVLAIIALIATPIVMNVIKKANEGAAERSADNYIKAVETLIATSKLDGNPVADGEYVIDGEGNLTFGDVEVSGTKPVGGTVKIENGQVVKDGSTIDYTDYTVTFESGVPKAETGESKKLVTLSDVCNFLEDDAHNEGRNPNTVGAKYTCDLGAGARNFYVLEAGTSSKPATLILEGNYDMDTLAWCISGNNNTCEADGLSTKLDDIVESTWTKLDRSQIGIPSMEQIMVADGKAEDAYLEQSTLTNEWLYSYPEYDSMAPYGYWTSNTSGDTSAWYVIYVIGSGARSSISGVNSQGSIRPIITLSI